MAKKKEDRVVDALAAVIVVSEYGVDWSAIDEATKADSYEAAQACVDGFEPRGLYSTRTHRLISSVLDALGITRGW